MPVALRRMTETERFFNPQVDTGKAGSATEIAWDDRVAWCRVQIESAKARYDYVGAVEVRRKRRTIVELRVAVVVASSRDVERRARPDDDEWTQHDVPRCANRAAEDKSMADIERGPAVLLAKIVGVGRETSGAIRVAVGLVE